MGIIRSVLCEVITEIEAGTILASEYYSLSIHSNLIYEK